MAGCKSLTWVLFFIDVVVGTLLHRMGMTGAPMAVHLRLRPRQRALPPIVDNVHYVN
jgi:hypothetical protein